MKYLKTFEYAFRNGTTPIVVPKEMYIIFDDNEGYTLNKEEANKQKIELLKMFKEYFEIDKDTEEYAMDVHAWAWSVRSIFGGNSISISIVTTNGWSISTNAIVIKAEEFITVGLENLDTYLDANNYNL